MLPYTSVADPLNSDRVGNRQEKGWCLSLTVCFDTARSPLTALTHSLIHPCATGEGQQAQLYGHGKALFLSAFGYSICAKPAPKLNLHFPNVWQSFSGYSTRWHAGHTSGWAGTTHTMLLQQALEIRGCHGSQVRS